MEELLFTGIIEGTGIIQALQVGSEGGSLTIQAKALCAGLKPGNSIAINGVCLTVTRSSEEVFLCQLSPETLRRTSFGQARAGMLVNLERPIALGDRLGGHFVLGHIDGIGRVSSITPRGDGCEMAVQFPEALERYFVYKGSVAVDGISLTIASLERDFFSVALIPHTLLVTNLRELKMGDPVNLEVDILGKYWERFFQLGIAQKEIPEDFLKTIERQGF